MAGEDYIQNNISRSNYSFRGVEKSVFVFDVEQLSVDKIHAVTDQAVEVFLPKQLSCRSGLTQSQYRIASVFGMGLGIAGLIMPALLIVGAMVVLWSLFASLIIWRFALLVVGWRCMAMRRKSRPVTGSDRTLPIYSILVPVYDEAPVMAQLARALGRIDWPVDRLDIQILLEEDDAETLRAAKLARFPAGTRFTIIPPGGPRTKPNALNYGLARARGDYVCIYDAEDRPAPSQLREAYAAFVCGGARLACVQAPLVASNVRAHWLSANWGLEYAVQFGFLLPALAGLRLPILIGGTSNHFDGLM